MSIRIFLSMAACILQFSSCNSKARPQEETSREKRGEEYARIVTLGGTITEVVCALDACSAIVATDVTSTFPAEMQDLQTLGYRAGIKAEGIIAQQPDLVIAENDYMKPDVYTQLESAGLPFEIIENKNSLSSTLSMIREMGILLGRVSQAQKLEKAIQQDMEKVDSLLKHATSKPKVLFVYARGHGTLNVSGTGTFAEEMIRMAGGELAVKGIEGFKPLTTEALIESNPDYILFFDSGLESLGGVEGALAIQGIQETIAGQRKNFIAQDGLYLSGFGPRVGQAVYDLALLIHPELSLPSSNRQTELHAAGY